MTPLNKTSIINALIETLKEENDPKDIRTEYLTNYESPSKITSNKVDKEYIPDLEVTFNDSVHIFEIELDEQVSMTKMRLFSTYSKGKNGIFHLVIPEWIKSNVTDKIEKSDIDLEIIEFKQDG